jgi:catechol 2,3-dioxygenase-like lactoylglutathione lyase family enzyme
MDLNHLNLRVGDVEACRDFYQRHFRFEPAFEAEGGYFLRNAEGFLLALVPSAPHRPLPEGFHIGFALPDPGDVATLHAELAAAAVRLTEIDDHRPGESYVTFRCWDPDGTEVEVYWDDA